MYGQLLEEGQTQPKRSWGKIFSTLFLATCGIVLVHAAIHNGTISNVNEVSVGGPPTTTPATIAWCPKINERCDRDISDHYTASSGHEADTDAGDQVLMQCNAFTRWATSDAPKAALLGTAATQLQELAYLDAKRVVAVCNMVPEDTEASAHIQCIVRLYQCVCDSLKAAGKPCPKNNPPQVPPPNPAQPSTVENAKIR